MEIEQKQKIIAGIQKRLGNLSTQSTGEYLNFLGSIIKVVDFYYEDEKIDFECSTQKKGHIFKHLKIVKEFLRSCG